uniref:Uncharacterized protein n=1 Tax=Aegilops tauschii subsp. strangulata TaxID=200361 RepID=A0A453AMW9_AEGTS
MSDDGFLESLFGKFYHDESLRPPPESGDGEAEDDSWDWHEALVDNAAYMIYERNHTTAQCPVSRKVRGGGVKQDFLQVTFCLSQPPHISYFCMSYTSRDPSQFRCEPTIFATEGNLAVIGLIHNWTLQNSPSCVYFVYRAPILGSQFPQLTLLPHPPSEVFPEQYESECQLGHNEIGILRYRSNSASKHLPFTPPTPTLSHNPLPPPFPAVANPTPPATTMMPTRSQRFAIMVLISTFSTSTIPSLTLGAAHPRPFHGRRTLPPSISATGSSP